MHLPQKALVQKEELAPAVVQQVQQLRAGGQQVVVVTAGAGDIDACLPELKKRLVSLT
jgi:glutamate 5-kinase